MMWVLWTVTWVFAVGHCIIGAFVIKALVKIYRGEKHT